MFKPLHLNLFVFFVLIKLLEQLLELSLPCQLKLETWTHFSI